MLQFMSDFFTYRYTQNIISRIFDKIIFNDATKVIASLFVVAFVVYLIKRVLWG